MTILFNLLGLSGYQGQEVFMENILKAVARLLPKRSKIIIAAPPYLTFDIPIRFSKITLCQLKPQALFSKPIYNYTINQLLLPFLLRNYHIDVVFSPTALFPIFYGLKNIVTIHDCAYRRFKAKGNLMSEILLHLFTLAAKFLARKIITVSYFSKKELIKLYKISQHKIEVLYEATPLLPKTNSLNTQAIIKKLEIQKPFFLHIGITRPQKNIIRLLKAFKLFSQKHQNYSLILVGKIDTRFINIKENIKTLNLTFRVKQTNFINNDEKIVLLQNAKALILPSLYEGFGLPLLEAQSLGIPVITSNCASMPEIAGKGALLVNPYKTKEIAKAMAKIIDDKTLREKLIRNGFNNLKRFSWQKSAQKLIDIFLKA